ncbi:ribosomal RNA small subunit methyltransferase E [Flexivirga endophytica]|uniref:Ribosomal RNA small subunit methyltransferase E n=1 Tax=Flexivirga endophytica TaxID=1849103 RepID=A0A916WX85_9MICO|nr:16S rRNA (uracil(1498)-N(3))-methyltransferase [Flexivirga endophytica]GGB41046.1 ribosomal RNA small subunit methyltransferase E [Flexivirga endophytica]GHB48842.1 ribosomal RNA small subunit methyltransferase E [Flexivirga endophytica]
MTARLFFAAAGALDGSGPGDTVTVTGDEARHAVVVSRLEVGETVQVADGSGRVAEGEIVAAARDRMAVQIVSLRESNQPTTRFVLMQALAKGGRDEQAVEAATELGVDAVIPWQADRSIVQWRGDKAGKAHRKWEALTLAASKQSRRATVPGIEPLVTSRTAPARLQEADAVVILHEDAEASVGEFDIPAGEVVVVVGPEGGISPDELGAFEAVGGRAIRLGPTVLRASNAGPTALAVLLARARW